MTFPWPWPPYGVFGGVYRDLGAGENKVMLDWMPGAPQPERLRTFKAWRSGEIDQIKDHLWPVFDRKKRRWEGRSTAWAALSSTREIEILIETLQKPGAVALDDVPAPPLAVDDMPDHREHYHIEDLKRGQPPGGNLNLYDKTLSETEYQRAIEVIDNAFRGPAGVGHKITGMFWVKTMLVRPRPHQVAMMVNRDDLLVEIANTAFHSAMMSGHALQGIILACAVYEDWLDQGQHVSQERLASLAQYGVDWGDRRVFAGVHYPADNISSWGLAMSLIPHVFRHADVLLPYARAAVTQHSRIYQIIKDRFPPHRELTPAMTYLDDKVSPTDPIA